jgi:alpha-glucosidase (family GH31 glycosyl hydrolase)
MPIATVKEIFVDTIGGTVSRPLFFKFPSDSNTYDISTQFTLGDGLMICPVLEEGAVTVDCYFPEEHFYDYYTSLPVNNGKAQTMTISAPIDHIPLYYIGGSVIPAQQGEMTLYDSRQNPYDIIVCMGLDGTAYGEQYIDDGEELDAVKNGDYTLFSYTAKHNTQGGSMVSIMVTNGYSNAEKMV